MTPRTRQKFWYPVVRSAVAAVIGFVAVPETHKTSLSKASRDQQDSSPWPQKNMARVSVLVFSGRRTHAISAVAATSLVIFEYRVCARLHSFAALLRTR